MASESEDVQAWAERQAARQRHVLAALRDSPGRWAARKAALAATGLEFVYTDAEGGEAAAKGRTAYRVVKKTATRLYVERRGLSTERVAVRDLPPGTRILSRTELERDGRVYPRRASGAYYPQPHEDTPAWRSEVRARIRYCRKMATPEAWIAHRERVDGALSRSPDGRS